MNDFSAQIVYLSRSRHLTPDLFFVFLNWIPVFINTLISVGALVGRQAGATGEALLSAAWAGRATGLRREVFCKHVYIYIYICTRTQSRAAAVRIHIHSFQIFTSVVYALKQQAFDVSCQRSQTQA